MLLTIGCFGLAYYVLHLPVIDFRAIKVGTNINDARKILIDQIFMDTIGTNDTNGTEEIITTEGLPPEG
jgi:hypothetical protein